MNIYPPGSIRALLETDLVTAPTRDALKARLDADAKQYALRFFDAESFATLQAVCARLIPQREQFTDIAREIDRRLADGWRYDSMPPDGDAYRRGLLGLNESAREMYDADFAALNEEQQDGILRRVQQECALGATWHTLLQNRFFEELLAEVTEIYFSHPLAQAATVRAGRRKIFSTSLSARKETAVISATNTAARAAHPGRGCPAAFPETFCSPPALNVPTRRSGTVAYAAIS